MTVKRRIRPVTDFGDEPMLDRVVPGIIARIADLMLPKAPLPQGKLPPLMPGCRLTCQQQMSDRLGDVAFEQAQASRIIGPRTISSTPHEDDREGPPWPRPGMGA